MPPEPTPTPPKESSRGMDLWRLLQILVIPATTLIIGQYASNIQEKESARRTYADMMNRRADAESALRKDMFQSTIVPFLDKKTDNIDANVLRLELLASNFNDTLDLSPLFRDAYRTLSASHTPASAELMSRLTSSAQEVIRKQVDSIREASTVRTGMVDLQELQQGPVVLFGSEPVSLPGATGSARTFRAEFLQYDKEHNEFVVRLTVLGAGNPPVVELQTKAFHIGAFDFPLIDNTRLAGGDRVALTFDGSAEDVAQVMLIYFPGSRASMKDKQYYEDMAAEMLRIEQRSRDKTVTAK